MRYTKQVVGQIYKYLDDVKVIKKENHRKAWKQMLVLIKGPYLYFFFTKIQRGGKACIISDFRTIKPFVIVNFFKR